MKTNANSIWWTRIVTFVVAGLVAASVTYWTLKGTSVAAPSQAVPVAVDSVSVDSHAVARALGGGLIVAAVQAPAIGSRYTLAGVVADRSSGGAALISVDGKPAKPVRVGAPVEGGLVLQSVAARRAVLASSLDAPAQVTLELPLRK
jgi:general secretion pathway protein C